MNLVSVYIIVNALLTDQANTNGPGDGRWLKAANRRLLAVILRAELVNGFDHGGYMFRRDARVNTVSEVENMAVTIPEARQDLGDLFTDMPRGGVKRGRVHVSLQGDLVADKAHPVGVWFA